MPLTTVTPIDLQRWLGSYSRFCGCPLVDGIPQTPQPEELEFRALVNYYVSKCTCEDKVESPESTCSMKELEESIRYVFFQALRDCFDWSELMYQEMPLPLFELLNLVKEEVLISHDTLDEGEWLLLSDHTSRVKENITDWLIKKLLHAKSESEDDST